MQNLIENELVLNQSNKYNTLTNKYQVIKTNDLITKFVDRGFTVDKVVVNKTRKKEKQGYQKHRVVFNMPDLKIENEKTGYAQLLLTNSYDGSSGIILQLGYYRLVCSNGLVVGNTFQSVSIRHTGIDLDKKLDSAIVEIAAQAVKLKSLVEAMQARQLSSEEIKSLELQAASTRTIKPELKLVDVITPVRRNADSANDLFTVFNRIQESHIKGGAKLQLVDIQGNIVYRSVRKIVGIDSSTKLNSTLFEQAEKLLQVA